MDAVRVQLEKRIKRLTDVHVSAVSDHMIKRHRNCTPVAYVGLHRLCNAKAYKYLWSMDRPTEVKECEGR